MEQTLYIGTNHFRPRPMHGCTQELKMLEHYYAEQMINSGSSQIRYSQKKLWTRIAFDEGDKNPIFGLELGAIIRIGCVLRLWKKVTPNELIRLKHRVCENSIEAHS